MPKKMRKNKRGPPPSGEREYGVTLNRRFQGQQPHSSFPDRVELMLDYWSANRVNPGVVTYGDTVFNVNSLFDPEFTGVGHQPREFDTWASIYTKYRVLEALCEVDVRQRAAHGISVCCVPSNSSTALVLNDDPQELPRAIRMGITGSAQPVARATFKIDPRAILGMTTAEFRGDDSTAALVTASPAQTVFLHVFATQLDGVTACDYEFTIRIRFKAEFYERKVLAPSALVQAVAARVSALQAIVEQERGAAGAAAAALDESNLRAPEPPRTSLADALAAAFLGTARPTKR